MLFVVFGGKTLHVDMYILQICIALPPPPPSHMHTNSVLNVLSQQKVVKKSAEKTRSNQYAALHMKPFNATYSQSWT